MQWIGQGALKTSRCAMRLSSAPTATRGLDSSDEPVFGPIKKQFRIIVVDGLQRRKSGKVDTPTIRRDFLKG